MKRPQLVVLAGANGSGKSTVAAELLQRTFSIMTFVNADTIARGMSAFNPEGAAIEAGRAMLQRMRALAADRVDFACETTLAGRSLATWLGQIKSGGYDIHIVFLWLSDSEIAVSRVSDRVRQGGHSMPEETIRRRYIAGLKNFFHLYRPLATTWSVCDNSSGAGPKMIAKGRSASIETVLDHDKWNRFLRTIE